jgi:hypothetical protein
MICGRPCRIHRQDMKQLLFFSNWICRNELDVSPAKAVTSE